MTSLCSCCGRPRTRRKGGGWRGAHGWCGTCSNLWYRAGKPAGGPHRVSEADRVARITATYRAARAERIQFYAWSRRLGLSIAQSAADAGVSEATGRVYERLRLESAVAGPEAGAA